MIILGNSAFATGMKLAGIKESYAISSKEQVLNILKHIDKKEFILANVSIMHMVPELKEYPNMVTIPDDVKAFRTTEDLKSIIKSAVGIELNI